MSGLSDRPGKVVSNFIPSGKGIRQTLPCLFSGEHGLVIRQVGIKSSADVVLIQILPDEYQFLANVAKGFDPFLHDVGDVLFILEPSRSGVLVRRALSRWRLALCASFSTRQK